MMLIDNRFAYSIPTHINFTLYKFDYIDSIIISRVMRECKNWNEHNNTYTITVDSFKEAVKGSKKLNTEIQNLNNFDISLEHNIKPSSISFLWSILNKLHNLEWLTFKVSYDKKFTRLIKLQNKKIISFDFKITEGVFNLTKIFDRESLDIINKKIIEFGIMPNKYLKRSPYFYMNISMIFDILGELEIDESLYTFDILDQIDPKIEEDNPTLLVITDYTSY